MAIVKSCNNILIKKVTAKTDIQICLVIRYQVFVKEQKVHINEELDGLDFNSEHYLLFSKQLPIGTARVRYVEDFAKIERVAILETYRNQGLGRKLINFIIEGIHQNRQVKKIKLGAQIHAIQFYEKIGFEIYTDEYLDAGIPHKEMQLTLE